jgi:Domain of unknown function (DUF5655)
MASSPPATPEEFFADSDEALAVYRRVEELVARAGVPFTVRTSKSQVTFRRRRGFAYVWMPGRYLKNPAADVVLSIALDRHITSERFKEVVHPAASVWMHHLEVHTPDDLDDEVGRWLHDAADSAA